MLGPGKFNNSRQFPLKTQQTGSIFDWPEKQQTSTDLSIRKSYNIAWFTRKIVVCFWIFLITSEYLQGFWEKIQEYFEKLKEFGKNSRILAKKNLNEPVAGRYT